MSTKTFGTKTDAPSDSAPAGSPGLPVPDTIASFRCLIPRQDVDCRTIPAKADRDEMVVRSIDAFVIGGGLPLSKIRLGVDDDVITFVAGGCYIPTAAIFVVGQWGRLELKRYLSIQDMVPLGPLSVSELGLITPVQTDLGDLMGSRSGADVIDYRGVSPKASGLASSSAPVSPLSV